MGWDRDMCLDDMSYDGGFDQSMADAQWDDDPANPANADDVEDTDYEYDKMRDDLLEHNATICNNLGGK